MEDQTLIQLENREAIAILRFDHGKVNTIDIELFTELIKQLENLEKSECKAVVLTGAGSSFSAGVDLFRLLKDGNAYIEAFVPLLTSGLLKLFTFPKPLVAAVNGHAIAGGCIVACACDYRLMAEGNGKIGAPEMRVGVPFPTLPLEILRYVIPKQHFQKIVYTGRLCSPKEAIQAGLIDDVVESENLLEHAIAVAERFAAIPTQSFQSTKRLMRQPVIDRFKKYRQIFDDEVLQIWKSEEIHAVIKAYLEKTIGKS